MVNPQARISCLNFFGVKGLPNDFLKSWTQSARLISLRSGLGLNPGCSRQNRRISASASGGVPFIMTSYYN